MEFSPVCIPMSLQPHKLVEAARTAINENALNAPHALALAAFEGPIEARIAVLAKKYWRTNGVRLTVGFLDTPPYPLRDKIVSHMNAWSKTTNVLFTATDDLSTAQVRISRGGGDNGGYWSFIGTDILSIPQDQPTMNLEQFTMATADSEFYRVVRHETGHTLGCPHEHMRAELIAKIDRDKANKYFLATQGWSAAMTEQQVLTPIEQSSLLGTAHPDPNSIMCYQIPGTITIDGQPILGGTDIDALDYQFMGTIYPLANNPGAAGIPKSNDSANHGLSTQPTRSAPVGNSASEQNTPNVSSVSSSEDRTASSGDANVGGDGLDHANPSDSKEATAATGANVSSSSSQDSSNKSDLKPKHPAPAIPNGSSSSRATAGFADQANDTVHVELPTGVRLTLPMSKTEEVIERIFGDDEFPSAGLTLGRSRRSHATVDQHDLKPAAAPGVVPAIVPPRIQQGILANNTDPRCDAGVIMACAIVGHSLARLLQGKNVRYDIEPPKNLELLPPDERDAQLKDETATRQKNVDAIARINKALTAYGSGFGTKDPNRVLLGLCPVYDINGVARVIGGTGDLGLKDPARYDPPLPSDVAGSLLYKLVTSAEDGKVLGYQGKGAYTGFVQGRETGQTGVFSTYRHVMPPDQPRWIPSAPQAFNLTAIPPVPPAPALPNQAYWGMLGTIRMQDFVDPDPTKPGGLKQQGMYFQDTDPAYKAVLTPTTVLGYTHGMIQAIYDVAFHKLIDPTNKAGTPYEIAVGKSTAKLASCFPCSIFMEATNFPASSTHLGRGECWTPLYPESPSGPIDLTTKQNQARLLSNAAWADYCKKIIDLGLKCVFDAQLQTQKHKDSLKALNAYVAGKMPMIYANLILDAVTVQMPEADRINQTLNA
jgi:hypothetical protein